MFRHVGSIGIVGLLLLLAPLPARSVEITSEWFGLYSKHSLRANFTYQIDSGIQSIPGDLVYYQPAMATKSILPVAACVGLVAIFPNATLLSKTIVGTAVETVANNLPRLEFVSRERDSEGDQPFLTFPIAINPPAPQFDPNGLSKLIMILDRSSYVLNRRGAGEPIQSIVLRRKVTDAGSRYQLSARTASFPEVSLDSLQLESEQPLFRIFKPPIGF
jgi:hypothetical protein